MTNKSLLIALLILNSIVLTGQLWPEGAPPFARTVNILTLVLNVLIFGNQLRKGKSTNG